MPEKGLSGSEGGVALTPPSLPLLTGRGRDRVADDANPPAPEYRVYAGVTSHSKQHATA